MCAEGVAEVVDVLDVDAEDDCGAAVVWAALLAGERGHNDYHYYRWYKER